MTSYLIRRLLAMLLLVIGISMMVFLILRLIPGDPAAVLLGTNAGNAGAVARLHHQLGLDQPLPLQYVQWVGNALHGNLGYSYQQQQPVTSLIAQNFPYTFVLAVLALALSLVLGGILGTIAALHQNSPINTVVMSFAITGFSIPSFWLGILLLLLFAVTLKWVPVFGGTSAKGIILPVVTLAIAGSGFLARFVRSAVLEARRRQYVTTARSKGLDQRQVLWRHVLRNAILPVLTVLGLQFGNLLSGAVIVETVFSRPGIGRLLVQSILAKDYLTVQGVVLVVATLYALVNLAVDMLYPVLDPRIQIR